MQVTTLSTASPRAKKTALAIGAFTLVAAAAALMTLNVRAKSEEPPAPASKPALTVTVVQPQAAQIAQTINANGSLHAWQEASVGAEANGWRLAEVRVNVGDAVRRGQVLATFASEMPQADLAQSKAAVAEAEAMLAEASANAQRARDLQQSGALSAQQIQQMLTAERTAQARLEAVRAQTQVQQLRLRQTQVLAPDDGVISARSATVGAVVPAGQELFRLIRQGRLEWRAEVAAAELSQVQVGQTVRLTPTGGAAIDGKVRMVAPTVDPATRNGLVFVDLPRTAAAAGAKAGMFARGEFDVGQSNAMTLPQSAVLLRDGFSYVFQVGADSKVTQTKVAVGRRVGERIEVKSGIEPRSRIVAQGGAFLGDGDLVRVVDAAPAVKPAASTTAATTTTAAATGGQAAKPAVAAKP
jgi:HlyD family secretion protein